MIYVCLYWILELVFFYSLVRRGYILKVNVQLVPKYFSHNCSTDSFSCSERKKRKKKIKTRQQINKGKSKRCCRHQSTWLIIAPLSHRYCSTVALLSLICRSVVAPLSHQYRSAVAPSLSLCCRAVVAPLSHRYCSTVAPLLLLLLSLSSHNAITPLSRHLLRCCRSCCRSSVTPLLLCCRTIFEPLSLRFRENINNSKWNCCCSTFTPLLLLLSIGRFKRFSSQEAYSGYRWPSLTVRRVCLPPQRGVRLCRKQSRWNLEPCILALSDRSWICGVAEILDKWRGSKIRVVASRGRI